MAATEAYADVVALLLAEGYELEDLTLSAIVHRALNTWLRREIKDALSLHAAVTGNGHQNEDRCDAWYALQNTLTMMQNDSHRFVHALLDPVVNDDRD